jgi:hypothetical protein
MSVTIDGPEREYDLTLSVDLVGGDRNRLMGFLAEIDRDQCAQSDLTGADQPVRSSPGKTVFPVRSHEAGNMLVNN